MEILDIIKEAKQVYGDKAKEVIVNEWPLEAYDGKNKARSPFNSDTTASCMWNQKELCWKDFSSGRVIGILDLFQHKYGDTYKEAIVRLCEETGVTLPDDGNWTGYNKGELLPKNYRYPYITEQSFNNRKDVEEYLGKRGLSIATLDHFGIKEDEHKNIVFEFFDADNMLLSVKLRPSHRIRPPEPKMFWQSGSDNCPLLFNVNRVNFEQPLVITEGNIDAMSVFEAGYYNVVSIPGGVQDIKWIEFNYKFLENFSQFIVWTDNDEAGQQGRQKIVKRLGEYNCKIVTPTDDVLDVIESYYQQYDANSHIRKADANNVLIACGGGMILNLLKTAKEIENPKVKRLMDYDEQQLQDLPRISTGFKAIDRVMYGNFENSLTVLTGKAGSGKSTWLNQFFIAEPLEAGERVLIYSGELPARILLGNILRPLASRRHIIELDNGEDQPKGYKVTTEASKAIKSYYRDNLFVFDDLDELETSGGGLLEAMEYSYKRYGITSYVIDNLMTVDMRGVDGESKIDRQIQFVKRLKKFTREYPVKVLLVAHARKLASGQAETGLDDISGASEIVKLCDRCYDVKVVHNDDTEDALAPSTKISVIKDRQAGRVGAKFELYFDECSSRIYTDEPERDKQYAWERDLWRQKKEIQYPEVIKNHIVANLPDRAVSVKVETADGEKPDDMPF